MSSSFRILGKCGLSFAFLLADVAVSRADQLSVVSGAGGAQEVACFELGRNTARLAVSERSEDGCLLMTFSRGGLDQGPGTATSLEAGLPGESSDPTTAVGFVTGVSCEEASTWTATSVTEYCADEAGVRVSRLDGAHRLDVEIPRAFGLQRGDLLVAIDGKAELISVPLLEEGLAASAPLVETAGMVRLKEMFRDPGLAEEMFLGALILRDRQDAQTESSSAGCGNVCFQCALSVGRMFAGVAGVVYGCNVPIAALSLGQTCVVAFASLSWTVADTSTQCIACDQCRHPPPPGGSAGCDQAGGCCPRGYHACCGNACCSDTNPPGGCN
jgi:hypothetical protein